MRTTRRSARFVVAASFSVGGLLVSGCGGGDSTTSGTGNGTGGAAGADGGVTGGTAGVGAGGGQGGSAGQGASGGGGAAGSGGAGASGGAGGSAGAAGGTGGVGASGGAGGSAGTSGGSGGQGATGGVGGSGGAGGTGGAGALCGNGTLDTGEACDIAIGSGTGVCPTACNDNDICTIDDLAQGGTCDAVCTTTPVSPANGDTCCPPGAHANNDNDCSPVCGNSEIEGSETCDDGARVPNDGCDANCQLEGARVAFRMTSLALRDPHVKANVFGSCLDPTDTPVGGISINGAIADSVTQDADGNGDLDLNFVMVFDGFDQNRPNGNMNLWNGACPPPHPGTTCAPAAGASANPFTSTNQSSGTCLAPLPGTTGGWSMPPAAVPIEEATAPCFVTNGGMFPINLAGVAINLQSAQVAAQYVGDPATGMVQGLLTGFISEADANASLFPATVPVIGGNPLSSVLPGGAGSCGGDATDTGPGGVKGWYFYLNFEATKVDWTP